MARTCYGAATRYAGLFEVNAMTHAAPRPQLAHLTAVLDQLRANGTHFNLRILDDQQAPLCHYDGRRSSTWPATTIRPSQPPQADRGRAGRHPRLRSGSGAVRTIAGTMRIHMDLEEKIAHFKNVEACVVFQSGFTANAGTVSSILGKGDFILSDELNHASISTARACPEPKSRSSATRTRPTARNC